MRQGDALGLADGIVHDHLACRRRVDVTEGRRFLGDGARAASIPIPGTRAAHA
jgi:hypothetical protein